MGLKIGSIEYNQKLSEYEEKLKNRKEVWRTIYVNGNPTKFSVSNFARIRDRKTGKIKEYDYNRGKYFSIDLKDGHNLIDTSLHRLVAYYFCEIPKRLKDQGLSYDQLVVNHKNGIKSCDASFNLEWVTQQENMQHAFKTKLCSDIFGELSHLSKIKKQDVIKICKLIMDKKTNKEISEITGIGKKTIKHIRSQEDWKEITLLYDFPKLSDKVPYMCDEKKIHEVCKFLELHKYSDSEIAKKTGVDRRYINDIRNKRRRTDISNQYNIKSNPVTLINEEMIITTCKLLEQGNISQRKIAKIVGISQCTVSEIYNHKKYTNISCNYTF